MELSVRQKSSVTTVLLDADGVVQSTSAGWLDAVGGLCGIPGQQDRFLEDVFAAERPALTGNGDFRSALSKVLDRWNSPASLDEAIGFWNMIQPHPGVLEQATVLRAGGVRVSLATNQQPERAAFMTEALGYAETFDDLFYSCEIGHAKPDQTYFRAVLDRLNQSGAEVLFVDDNEKNVASARGVGLNAEVYDSGTGSEGMRMLLAGYSLMVG